MGILCSGPLTAWRIASSEFINSFDGEGARRKGQRWNPQGQPAIYAAESFALAMLEVLVGANGVPPPMSYLEIQVGESVGIEKVSPDDCVGWDRDDYKASQFYGEAWYQKAETAVLLVPSRVTCVGGFSLGNNLVINPHHRDFIAGKISRGISKSLAWDPRIFRLFR